MRKVQILTDSCSDMDGELLARYNIDYVKMNTVLDGKTTPASLTWDYYSPKALYDTLRAGQRVTTTQVPVEEFQRAFRKYLSEGCDIVYVGCSLKQSGSVNTGKVVAGKLKEEFPDGEVYCIDSLRSCMGEGMLAIYAAERAAEGLPAASVAAAVEAARNRVNQFCTVHTLDYLRRAGRVKGSAAFFGNLMGVKPILICDADGEQTPLKKVKGRENSLREIVARMKEVIGPADQTIYLVHADCPAEELDTVTALLHQELPKATVRTGYIGPIIGASVGPDAIALYAWGKEVTYRVKETMQ